MSIPGGVPKLPAMPMASGLVIAFEIPERDFMNCASRPSVAQGARAAAEPRQSRAHPYPDHAHTRLWFTTCSCRLSRLRRVLLWVEIHLQAILSEPQHPPGPTFGRPGVPSIAQILGRPLPRARACSTRSECCDVRCVLRPCVASQLQHVRLWFLELRFGCVLTPRARNTCFVQNMRSHTFARSRCAKFTSGEPSPWGQ